MPLALASAISCAVGAGALQRSSSWRWTWPAQRLLRAPEPFQGPPVERAAANAVIRIIFDSILDLLLDRRDASHLYRSMASRGQVPMMKSELMLMGVN